MSTGTRSTDEWPMSAEDTHDYTLEDTFIGPAFDPMYESSSMPPSESPEQIVSRTFHPDALINGFAPDKILVSSDNIQFFVHSFFASTIWTHQDTIVNVEDDAVVLNIILHTLYNISCAPFQPSLGSLSKALDRLVFYGMEPTIYIVPTKSTFDVLTSHAPYLPLELYTLAGRLDLYDLALVASSHLLSLKLSSLSDEVCGRMGARYLLRLFRMHIDRMSALKDLVIMPPNLHPETSSCRARQQEAMIGEWAIVVAYLSRDASPAISSSLLISQFRPVVASTSCWTCLQNINTRLDVLSAQWSTVKCTI